MLCLKWHYSCKICSCVDSHWTDCQFGSQLSIMCQIVEAKWLFVREVQESTFGQWKPPGKSTAGRPKWQVLVQYTRTVKPGSSIPNPFLRSGHDKSFDPVNSMRLYCRPYKMNSSHLTKTKIKIQFSLQYPGRGFLWNMIRYSIKTIEQNHDSLPEYMAQRCWILDVNVLWNWTDQRQWYERVNLTALLKGPLNLWE